jgi:hypothetical protein
LIPVGTITSPTRSTPGVLMIAGPTHHAVLVDLQLAAGVEASGRLHRRGRQFVEAAEFMLACAH